MPSRTREIVINSVAQKVFQIEIYLRIKFFIISFFLDTKQKKIIFMEPNLLKKIRKPFGYLQFGHKIMISVEKKNGILCLHMNKRQYCCRYPMNS